MGCIRVGENPEKSQRRLTMPPGETLLAATGAGARATNGSESAGTGFPQAPAARGAVPAVTTTREASWTE
jgi:hypothetical protein